MTRQSHAVKRNDHSYQVVKATIQELFDSGRTREPSVKALRTRAREGILVYLESKGPIQYYDRELSVIRVSAAWDCKRPGIQWKGIGRAVRDLDALNGINPLIIETLEKGGSAKEAEAQIQIARVIREKMNG